MRSVVLVVAAVAGVSELRAQGTATVQIRTLGSSSVQNLTLAPGVHRLRAGGEVHCIYLESGAKAVLMAVPNAAPQLTNARLCTDVWSEVVIDSVPDAVEVLVSGIEAVRRGNSAIIRVPLPDTLRVSVTGLGFATQSGLLQVGAMERHRYVARLARAPTLLPDTILEALPPEVAIPRPPSILSPPVDPGPALAAAIERQRIMSSRQPAASASSLLSWPLLGAAVASLVTGIVWASDTLDRKPNAGRNFAISLGVTGGVLAVYWPLNRHASSRAERAQCGGNRSVWRECESRISTDVQRLRADAGSLAARRAQWVADTLNQVREFERARATYPEFVAARNSAVTAIEARNAPRIANRTENDRRLDAWRVQVARSPFQLRSRTRRN